MGKMWEARHYKARLEAMATLKMSGCVPPLAIQDNAYKYSLPKEETLTNGWDTIVFLVQNVQPFYMSRSTPYIEEFRGL